MPLDIPSAMQAHLDTNATTICYCWKITLNNGTVKGFTDHDKNITLSGVTYLAETGFSPSAIKHVFGSAVDDMEVIGFISADALESDDILNKLYDNAAVTVYAVNWQDITQVVDIFNGFLGTITTGTQSFTTEVRSLRQMLLQPAGRSYLTTCDAQLGDARCGIDLSAVADYRKIGTVTAAYSQRLFNTTTAGISSLAVGWFNAGKITWLTGNNAGYVCEIKSHIKQVQVWIDLWEVMPADITVGDTFELQVGCDKRAATCKAKFNNISNFRGFPHMPRTEIALKFAAANTQYANGVNGGSWFK